MVECSFIYQVVVGSSPVAVTYLIICGHVIRDALRDLVPFVQFKKREKHPWRSVTFRKLAG